MPENREKTNPADRDMEIEGLPMVRANVAGIDLGSQKHWVCAPKPGGQGREIKSFGATTPELGACPRNPQDRGNRYNEIG